MEHERDGKTYTSRNLTDLVSDLIGLGQVVKIEVTDDETGESVVVVGTSGYEDAVDDAIARLQAGEDGDEDEEDDDD